MTEEGAKQILRDYRVVTGGFIDLREAIDIAIQALEEIQQYRELGTVEEILKVFNNQQTIIATQHETLKQYRAIGTVEGYERAIQSSIENYNLYREYKARVQEFEKIGTIEELQDLKSRLRSYKGQMIIYAEQHKVILASDVLEALEELEW